MTRSVLKILIPLAAAALLALSAASLSSGKATKQGDVFADLQAKIDGFRAVPRFKAPGPAFDARAAVKGKKLFSVPATSQVPFVVTIQNGMERVAKMVGGMQFIKWPNQGQVVQWVAGMNSAITQGADLIDLLAGVNPALIEPQIKQAKAKGIPSVASHFYGIGLPPHAPNLAATVDIPYELGGELMADWVILQTKGKANALVLTVNQVLATIPLVTGIKKEFAKYCKGCKLSYADRTIPELAKYQEDVQSALIRDPSINYVIAIYDSAQGPQAIAGIRAANRLGKVHIATFNGTPSFMPELKRGVVTIDVGENLDWIAYAIIDQEMRVLGGLKPVPNEFVPLRVFTKENVAQSGPKFDKGYGNSYVTGYKKLWKLG